ncbi:hypothetical protein RDI58_004165 [Solanum bulbocastanum]|uniref:Uncharacterized protein n=1 Tax=Solanum bulbocastanum TaxID=147425 RepID=A0AAN8YJW2_SOLBU
MSCLFCRSYYVYSKIEKEDPKEMQHRRTHFLIYKSLKKSDSLSQPTWLKVKISKLKIKIGGKLNKMRKSILLIFSSTKVVAFKQFISQLRHLFKSRHATVTLPPKFT